MKISNNAPVTLGFAFVSFVQILVASLTHGAGTSLFVSPHTFDFFSIQSWFASVLHVVGHANFEHFSGNILFIMLLGPMVEEKYGSTQLLFMIIGTAIATSVVNSLLLSGSDKD
jgi:GlpG protein